MAVSSFPATSSFPSRGSSSTQSWVIRVTTLVSTPKPAPWVFRLLATIISSFFLLRFFWLFSSICSVSMEKPQTNRPGCRFCATQPSTSPVRARGMDSSVSPFFILLSATTAGR